MSRPATRPEGRVTVVTGGSAGVGRAIALRFARAGDRVAVIGRSRAGVDSTVREIESAGGQALALVADVGDAAAVAMAADTVADDWGGIDVWVNNAMATLFAPLSQVSPEEFRRVTEVTYLGCVHGTMAALKHMRPRDRGLILQVGSALSYRGIPLQAAYCGAKFAIRGFTDALRSELLHEGSAVRVTMLQLPAVNTPQFDWARNLFPTRPRPVAPVFDPEAVAETAWRASWRAPREVWIGLPTLKVIAGALLAPAWLDRYLAGPGWEGQLSPEPDSPERPDNLFHPVEGGHRAEGRFSTEARRSVTAFDPAMTRWAAIGLAAGVAGLVALAARNLLTTRR